MKGKGIVRVSEYVKNSVRRGWFFFFKSPPKKYMRLNFRDVFVVSVCGTFYVKGSKF